MLMAQLTLMLVLMKLNCHLLMFLICLSLKVYSLIFFLQTAKLNFVNISNAYYTFKMLPWIFAFSSFKRYDFRWKTGLSFTERIWTWEENWGNMKSFLDGIKTCGLEWASRPLINNAHCCSKLEVSNIKIYFQEQYQCKGSMSAFGYHFDSFWYAKWSISAMSGISTSSIPVFLSIWVFTQKFTHERDCTHLQSCAVADKRLGNAEIVIMIRLFRKVSKVTMIIIIMVITQRVCEKYVFPHL